MIESRKPAGRTASTTRYRMYIFLIRLKSRTDLIARPWPCCLCRIFQNTYVNLILSLEIWLQRQRNRTFVSLSGENTSRTCATLYFVYLFDCENVFIVTMLPVLPICVANSVCAVLCICWETRRWKKHTKYPK